MEENQKIPPLPETDDVNKSEGRIVLGPVPEGTPPVFLKRSAKNAEIHRQLQEVNQVQVPEPKNLEPKNPEIAKPVEKTKGLKGIWERLTIQEKLFGTFAGGFITCAIIVGLFSWGLLQQLDFEPVEDVYQPVQVPLANDIESAHEQLLENIENGPGIQTPSSGSNQVLWTGVQGYLLGTYVAVENGTARQAPLSNSEALFEYNAGDSAEVSAIEQGLNDSVWGMIAEDTWILLQDGNRIAAIGPGQYKTLQALEILSGTGSAIGTMHSNETFIVNEINHFGSDIYGILENGSMVLMEADHLERIS